MIDAITYALLKGDIGQGTQEAVAEYLDEHLTNPSNPPIDTSLEISGAAADSKTTGDKITQLKEDLTEDNVPAVKRDMTYHAQVNYLDPNRLVAGYVTKNGSISTASTRCRTDYIPVSEGDVLRSYRREDDETILLSNDAFRNMSYIAAYDSAKQVIPSAGNDSGVNSYTVPEGVSFVILSFYNAMRNNLGMLTFNEEATEFVLYGDRYTADPAILDGAFSDKTAQPYPSIGHVTVTGDLDAGESLEIASTSCRKNMRYAFSCRITSFTGVKIGNSISKNNGSWIEIDDTNIVVKYRESNTDVTASTTPHGLTIADFVYAEIITGDDAKANITLLTNGGSFDLTDQSWGGYGANAYAVTSVSSILTDCVFDVSSSDFRKKIWLVGDSYINSAFDNRWPYYLKQNGFINNLLWMGFPGLAPREGWPLFKTALGSFGRPYYAIWALGMNGGGDTNDTIEALYWANLRYFLSRCKVFNVTPVLCTIPSVPALNHEARNTWIRLSGYRYIDFADAVGAQADGTWYSDMLSTDNVHPTALGAKALYMRAIRDFPELTFET